MKSTTIVHLSAIPSEAVHALNGLHGRRVHLNLTDGSVASGYAYSASAVQQVASFQVLGGDPEEPVYFRVPLAEIASLEVVG